MNYDPFDAKYRDRTSEFESPAVAHVFRTFDALNDFENIDSFETKKNKVCKWIKSHQVFKNTLLNIINSIDVYGKLG